jgi:hypothetical protein
VTRKPKKDIEIKKIKKREEEEIRRKLGLGATGARCVFTKSRLFLCKRAQLTNSYYS